MWHKKSHGHWQIWALPVHKMVNMPPVSEQMPKRKHSQYSHTQNLQNIVRSKRAQHGEGTETGADWPSLTITWPTLMSNADPNRTHLANQNLAIESGGSACEAPSVTEWTPAKSSQPVPHGVQRNAKDGKQVCTPQGKSDQTIRR